MSPAVWQTAPAEGGEVVGALRMCPWVTAGSAPPEWGAAAGGEAAVGEDEQGGA
ncbi:hypothetical protein SMICM304S_07043 [Streptomyces microflavus]